MRKRIKNVVHLKKVLASGEEDFVLLLNGNLRSSKRISRTDDGLYQVDNAIDDTSSIYNNFSEMMLNETNIMRGIAFGAFFVEVR